MAREHDRDGDGTFERALAQELRNRPDADGQCPDAEILGLISESALEPSERRTWDAHISTCSRCQAHLAALARTADDTALASGREERSAALAWLFDWRVLVPMATTAAVVLAVWTANPNVVTEPASQALSDRAAEAPTDVTIPAAETVSTPPDELRDADTRLDNQDQVGGLRERAVSEPVSGAVAEPAIADPTTVGRQTSEADQVDRLNSAVGKVEMQVAPPTEPEAERAERRARPATASPTPEQAVRAVRSLDARASDAIEERMAAAVETIVRSPNRETMWRLTQDGVIDRSVDAGASWVRQRTEAGVVFRAGSAPSNFVCWVVGAAGTIRRTTDGGATWVQIAAPRQADLVGVSADDAQTATIEAQDGLAFLTLNGGATWSASR